MSDRQPTPSRRKLNRHCRISGRSARNVIFCYMSGGVSAISIRLIPNRGWPRQRRASRCRSRLNERCSTTGRQHFPLVRLPFKQLWRKCGMPISNMFPEDGLKYADELCGHPVHDQRRSCEHAQAQLSFFTAGFPFLGHPSRWAPGSVTDWARRTKDLAWIRRIAERQRAAVPHGGVRDVRKRLPCRPKHQGSSMYQSRSNDDAVQQHQATNSRRQAAEDERLNFVRRNRRRPFTASVRSATTRKSRPPLRNYETAYRMQVRCA